MNKKSATLFLLFLLGAFFAHATVVYVDSSNINGSQNGQSWATAFAGFQNGINAATSGDTIWVARGTYRPPAGGSFTMKEGVKIFGGFLNTYNSFNQRNWSANSTYLKGNGNAVIRNDSNSLTQEAVIDGFTITGGKTWNGALGGGGIYNRYASPIIRNCHFYKDTVTNFLRGGAICNYNASPEISHCIFTANLSFNGGGAICNYNAPVSISHCIFDGNNAGGGTGFGGGAICNINSAPVIISDCTFNMNTGYSGNAGGGAIFNSSSTVTISNSNFTGNQGFRGGAILNEGSSLEISHSAFVGNQGDHVGAAMNIGSSVAEISDCIFENNTSQFASGGALFNAGTMNVANSLFTGNICSATGSVKGGGAIASANSVTNCGFQYNRAYSGGGVLNVEQIKRCNFFGNIATYAGGGICQFAGYPATIESCNITGDTALIGGGVAVLWNAVTLVNNVIAKNVSDSSGSGFFSGEYASSSLDNCTIVGNVAASGGGAVYNVFPETSFLTNTILWGNSDSISAPQFALPLAMRFSLVQGQPANIVYHNLDGTTDPQFANSATGDYSLLFSSPCVNEGFNDSIPAGVVTDITGGDRIWSGTVDMGAHEYAFKVDLIADTTFCDGNELTVSAGNPGASYLWSTGDTTQSITVSQSGVYTVTVLNTFGSISDTVAVMVVPLPVVNLGNDTTIAAGAHLVLNAGNAGSQYLWNTGAITQTISVTDNGNYHVSVTNGENCSASDTILVSVTLSTEEISKRSSAYIRLSPNPATDELTLIIENSELMKRKVTISDISGHKTQQFTAISKITTIRLNGLIPGIYLVQVDGTPAVKFVKE